MLWCHLVSLFCSWLSESWTWYQQRTSLLLKNTQFQKTMNIYLNANQTLWQSDKWKQRIREIAVLTLNQLFFRSSRGLVTFYSQKFCFEKWNYKDGKFLLIFALLNGLHQRISLRLKLHQGSELAILTLKALFANNDRLICHEETTLPLLNYTCRRMQE